MIVRRFNRASGAECKPVSVKQAAWAIARALNERPTAGDAENIAMDLLAGQQNQTGRYRYVPDADGNHFPGKDFTNGRHR